ncbi:hypothetical protein B0H13DRAFT_1932596 [Mycena leptocephala]|nr:hypothetical protein B0H13DRAFT_1932596 [Mycena leptocephala]
MPGAKGRVWQTSANSSKLARTKPTLIRTVIVENSTNLLWLELESTSSAPTPISEIADSTQPCTQHSESLTTLGVGPLLRFQRPQYRSVVLARVCIHSRGASPAPDFLHTLIDLIFPCALDVLSLHYSINSIAPVPARWHPSNPGALSVSFPDANSRAGRASYFPATHVDTYWISDLRCVPGLSIAPISIFPAALASPPFPLHDSRPSASVYPYACACAAQLQLEGGPVDHYTHRAAQLRLPGLSFAPIFIFRGALAAHPSPCSTQAHLRLVGALGYGCAHTVRARGYCAVRWTVSRAICAVSPAPVSPPCRQAVSARSAISSACTVWFHFSLYARIRCGAHATASSDADAIHSPGAGFTMMQHSRYMDGFSPSLESYPAAVAHGRRRLKYIPTE